VKVLFLILVDLCRRTSSLQHPLPVSQVGTSNIIIRLHFIDGTYTVLPEVVEASLGPHMQVQYKLLVRRSACCKLCIFCWSPTFEIIWDHRNRDSSIRLFCNTLTFMVISLMGLNAPIMKNALQMSCETSKKSDLFLF
jgi:hypothetical protein